MFVLIVRLMAGHTVLLVGGLEPQAASLDVTGAAREGLMGPAKLISAGELTVVEGPNVQPRLRSVAGEALPGESQGHVIDLLRSLEVIPVTCEAVRG
jgi:hypothetical protein